MANRTKRFFPIVFTLLFVLGCDNGKLTVSKIEPNIGPTEGGHVNIFGNGFQSKGPVGVTVYFGDKKGRIVEVSDGKISARAPAGKEGDKVDVKLVFDDAREFRVAKGYEYRDVNKGFDVDSLTQK